ncbi:DUF2280 domain-containing protein [Pseudomonas aeruginosa]|uniref:DUF2280 domain-containing protein n=1 Tax=Pseudomonas aeruginosa TaxID=287 RepID=UPI000B493205|nr:DUF2280 domain-containing protein [Pseudomonas aeruginosa]MBG6364531.1 DUF2280 domain-containing protein [Pseudomonas aeruginosa]MCU9411992.1 DUF2280 domain-containing protein [Pseudomonas aeruginosa]OWI80601.1 hypothetical protein CDC21_18560 [Pseudomonas aeruginosa]HBO5485970.1 DUF2280 domain-containing protein [Pseudomonas aeruginosa]HCF0797785.1 DUF2280 domain-containing protein [Pseudomonas aeruginosa]
MAVLNNEVKAFIVQALACFDTPAQVAASVREEFGIEVSRQQCESHDPTKSAGRDLAKRWRTLFEDTRKRFREEIADIPIANRAYRLRALARMAERAEGMRNMALAAQLYEQAAKESGGMYSNKHQLEHSGPGGGPILTMPTTIQLVAPGHDHGED